MQQKLSDWAKTNGHSYLHAWRLFDNGKIPNARKSATGQISVETNDLAEQFNDLNKGDGTPLSVAIAGLNANPPTLNRRNVSSVIERTDKYANIENSIIPFRTMANTAGSSNITVRDAIILCQKAFYSFAIFRQTIDIMTEFCCDKIYFRGGSQKSRDFFEALLNKINLIDFQDKFFREFWRSGNVFCYRYDAQIKKDDITKIINAFASEKNQFDPTTFDPNDSEKLNKKNIFMTPKEIDGLTLPARYIMLNPADIQIATSTWFVNATYYKFLSDYELEALRDPKTEEDKLVLQNFSPGIQKLIKSRIAAILVPLDHKKVIAVFNKKQDYEPFAIPMGYPVLEDLNWKAELKKMDMAISRTMQQVILLITTGTDPDKGGINPKNLLTLQQMFLNESIGRVLVADYTTKAQWVIPQIADILDPKKYEIVNQDIQIGLNNILLGTSEKFANQSIKVQVFVERLKKARESFINNFLLIEIKRIAKELGFKNWPTPFFEEINLRDEIQFNRIYTRLAEIGVLTPDETINAIENAKLPTSEESIENQTKLAKLKQKGLYAPLIGGGQNQQAGGGASGRPAGSKGIPQSTKNVKPIGTSHASFDGYSLTKIKDNMILAQGVQEKIEKTLLEKHNLKALNGAQKEIAESILEKIVCNEEPNDWDAKANDYIDNPIDKNENRIEEIQEIAYENQINHYSAAILLASKKEFDEKDLIEND